MRDLLVQVTRFDAWSNSLRYAAALAALMKTSLTALHCVELVAPFAGNGALAAASDPVNVVEAAWAVEEAMPLLERTRRVVLLMGSESGSLCLAPRQPPFDLDGYCERHDLRIERVPMDRANAWTATTLLEATLAAKSELLVMGATGRTRMSERLFGDVTQHMLRNCPIPLLLRH